MCSLRAISRPFHGELSILTCKNLPPRYRLSHCARYLKFMGYGNFRPAEAPSALNHFNSNLV